MNNNLIPHYIKSTDAILIKRQGAWQEGMEEEENN